MSYPRLELDLHLEDIKMSVNKAISELEIKDYIKKETEKVIDNYNFERKIKEVVTKKLNKEIENYFTYGKGSIAIRESIEKGFRDLEE